MDEQNVHKYSRSKKSIASWVNLSFRWSEIFYLQKHFYDFNKENLDISKKENRKNSWYFQHSSTKWKIYKSLLTSCSRQSSVLDIITLFVQYLWVVDPKKYTHKRSIFILSATWQTCWSSLKIDLCLLCCLLPSPLTSETLILCSHH